jgi:predicted ABC-class ATPase
MKMSIQPRDALRRTLGGCDGQDFAAYQALRGAYDLGPCELHLDRIPKDSYAPPGTGTFRVRVPWRATGLPEDLRSSSRRAVVLRDFLARRLGACCRELGAGRRGSGNSGLITVTEPGPAILDRSAVALDGDAVEARIFIGLPARGRAIDAPLAERMLLEEVPQLVAAALVPPALDAHAARRHVHTAEDADALRGELPARGLVAFVADGALLARRSSVDPGPLPSPPAVPFSAPPSMRVEIEVPHAGRVSGMGIPAGVTLIVGGGFHGKSTLVQAIQDGVYDHAPGDGRDLCVTDSSAVKVRAHSGRHVAAIDISGFVADLPGGGRTDRFCSENASGSTSQAASLMEAIEMGARLVLLDEDTCAVNLMARDRRMQLLVDRRYEPLSGYVDHARVLRERGISTILVTGALGAFLDVADHVLQLCDYQTLDVSANADRVARESPTGRVPEMPARVPTSTRRIPHSGTTDPTGPHGHRRIAAPVTERLVFGTSEVDLSDVEQLLEPAQTRALGEAVDRIRLRMDGTKSLPELVRAVADEVSADIDTLDEHRAGDVAGFRPLELAACLNRLRGVDVTVETGVRDSPDMP